jgi:long-chain fatty acid transport protein
VASPAKLFGQGARSQALGGTGVAHGGGQAAAYTNPAELARDPQRHFTLGYQVARFRLRAPGVSGAREEGLGAFALGLEAPIPFGGVLEDRFALGLSVLAPYERITRGRILSPETPQFPLLADQSQSLNFALGLGANLLSGLRLGAGVLAQAELVGETLVRTEDDTVSTDADSELLLSFAPVLGVSYELSPALGLGLVYRGALASRFDQRLIVEDFGPLTLPELFVSGIAQYDPEELGAEIALLEGPWHLALGVSYERWSRFAGFAAPAVRCPAEDPDCDALGAVDIRAEDTVGARFGAQYQWALDGGVATQLRAGYAFSQSPLPAQRGDSNWFDNDRHTLTLGYGLEVSRGALPLRLELAFQHHFLAPRSHEKAATSRTVETGGSVQNLSINAGVKF